MNCTTLMLLSAGRKNGSGWHQAMNEWLKRILQALLLILLVAGVVRLAWELLRPATPALVALLVMIVVIRLLVGRSKGW